MARVSNRRKRPSRRSGPAQARPWPSPARRTSTVTSAERLLQKLVDDLGIGLAAGRLHHLADEPAEQSGLGLVGRDLAGVGIDHGLDGGLDGAGVGDLLQPALLDPRRRILARLLH